MGQFFNLSQAAQAVDYHKEYYAERFTLEQKIFKFSSSDTPYDFQIDGIVEDEGGDLIIFSLHPKSSTGIVIQTACYRYDNGECFFLRDWQDAFPIILDEIAEFGWTREDGRPAVTLNGRPRKILNPAHVCAHEDNSVFVWNDNFRGRNFANMPPLDDTKIVVITNAHRPDVTVYDITGLTDEDILTILNTHISNRCSGTNYRYKVVASTGNVYFVN